MTPQPQTAASAQTVPRTPAAALGRYLAFMGAWLKKNLKEALTVAVVGFVIGWVMNFVLMAFFYDGFRIDETMAASGQGNVRNGMLIWSLFSSVAFGLIAYRRAVGKERFRSDLANFPGAVLAVFRKDGDAVWTHILWGAAVSLLATFLIARWAGLGVAAMMATLAFSPLGLILAAMITQLWRAIMRSLMPQKTRRAAGAAGLFVGLFTSSLVLLAGFFIANEREKLILGGFCLVAALVVGMGRKPAPAAATLLLLAPVLWLLFPELGLADDGGFKEAGGDFSAWAQGGGLGEIVGYSNYGGVAAAIGGLAGWVVGAVNGASPPPEGGWDAGLEGEPDLDPGGAPAGEGLPEGAAAGAEGGAETTDPLPEGVAPSPAAGETEDAAAAAEDAAEDAAAAEAPPAGAAAPPADPEAAAAAAAAAAPALAADGLPDRELTDDEIAALSEEDYRKWRNRAPAGDPDSPAEILRRARAGDPEAAARWEEIKGEGDPSFLDRAASVVLGPAYDAIGGSETLIELAKTDWIDEGLDTAAALGNAAGRRIGQIADTAAETVSGAIDLAGMDADEVSGMFGAIGDSIANSTVGRIVGETVEGAVELASMDADELVGMVGQVRDDAADAVVERIDQARALVEDMTFEEAVAHLERTRDAAGQALTEADRAIRRQAQEVMRMNPDKVRDALADGTIAVVEELVVEVATGGAGAIRHADEAVDLARAAGNATDAARAAENATDAARAADRGSDAARAGTPDAPPVRDAPEAPARPDTPDAPASPDAPDRPRAEAAEPAAPAEAAPERRGPGPAEGGRPAADGRARDADGPAPEGSPPRAAEPEPPAAGTPGRRTGPGDTVELDPGEGPGGVRPPGERPRGPGDTVELDPSDGPGGVRPPDAPRQPAAASSEGAPPARSEEPWTEADTVRTPRSPAEAPGGTDPGRPPRPASPAPDAPDARPRAADPGADTVADPPRPARPAESGDGDLVFEMEDGKRVNMTTNRPEPPRPGSPADLAARGDPPAAPPRGDPGADTLADGPPSARPPDQPEGDLIFEMEDGKRVNMTTNRPEPPRPGSPADPAVRADTEIQPSGRSSRSPPDSVPEPPAARTGPGGTQRLDPDDLPDGRTGPGGPQRLDPDDLPDARTGPGGTQRLDPDDLPDGRTGPGGTQRLDPDDLPDARTGPGGTQRLDPDDLPDARTGPGGTQRLDPDDLPDARTGPGGTQRLDPDDLPDGRTGPGGTQRLDPDDLPDARTGPGGTQRLDPDDLPDAAARPDGTQRFDPPDLPEGRTGPGGTQRLDSGDLPDGRRGAPVDRAPAGPGEEVRPGVRRAPDGTHQVRMSRTEAERILGDAGPGGARRTAPTERMPPDAPNLDDATPGSRRAPEDAGGPGAVDQPTPGDPVEAARRENDRFREGMENSRRDLDGPEPGADTGPSSTPADERPSGRSRGPTRVEEGAPAPTAPRSPDADPPPASSASDRPPPDGPEAASEAAEEPRPKPRRTRQPSSRARSDDGPGPATERLRDPDLPPDEATATARTRAEAMRDDMETIRNHPLDEAAAPGGRDRPGPATERLRDPELPPDEATATARTRAEAMRDDMETIRNHPLDDAAAPRGRDRPGPATERLRDPDLPPDEATATARARAEAMRDDMETIRNHPLDDAAAPGGRDRAGPATERLRDPDLPPDEATATARTRAEAMRDDMETIRNHPLDDAAAPGGRDRPGPATERLRDPELPPDEATATARTRAEAMRDDMETIRNHPLDDAAAPGGRDRPGPATERLRDPDLPPDEATAAGRARAEAMRDDMDAIGSHPLEDTGTARLGEPDLPPAERPSGASRRVDRSAETVAPPDTPPGRAARPGPADETPAPDAPAEGRGRSRGARPADAAPDVPVIPASEGRLLENQTVTARTVTGVDDLGRPIVHPHDEVTVPIGQHLKSGSFSDVFASTEGYFGSDPENTLVRISKPISTEAGAQSLRADRVGREALVQVQDEIASPRVLGTFEIMDETGGRRVMEVLENVTVGDQRGVRAADVLEDRAMNIEEAMAYDRATRALNDRGYVSLDLHEGNFTLIDQADGAKKLGVFDPGGIMPVRGNDPEVARLIQSRINAPDPDVLRVAPEFSNRMIRDDVRELLLQHVDGEALGIDLKEFIFKPNMGRNHPLVRELFGADDPEALYRQLRSAVDR